MLAQSAWLNRAGPTRCRPGNRTSAPAGITTPPQQHSEVKISYEYRRRKSRNGNDDQCRASSLNQRTISFVNSRPCRSQSFTSTEWMVSSDSTHRVNFFPFVLTRNIGNSGETLENLVKSSSFLSVSSRSSCQNPGNKSKHRNQLQRVGRSDRLLCGICSPLREEQDRSCE